MTKLRLLFAVAITCLCAGSLAVAGPIYYFERITANAVQNVEGQLSVEVLDSSDPNVDANQVGFKFRNNVGIYSSISEIYFDDGTLLGAPSIFNFQTDFANGANPANLPGGSSISPPFVASALFSADAVGNPSRGVDTATDWVELVFNLQSGKTYADTIAALDQGYVSNSNRGLRIGLHLRAIGSQSDGFVNTTAVVPLPAAAWMGMSLLGGVGGVGFFRRRRLVEA